MGAGAQCRPYSTQAPVTIGGVQVRPRDLIFADTCEGVVRIPLELKEDVVAWLQKRGNQEDKIKEMVASGSSVEEAFKKYR